MNSAARRFETVLNWIGEYSRRLGRVPASIYALGFAALILVFALFYWFVAWLSPAHAFLTAAQAAVQRCENNALTVQIGLNYELKAAYRASGQANQVINGWRMLSDRLEVSPGGPHFPDYWTFQLQMPFSNEIPQVPDNDVTVSEMVTVNTADAYILGDMAYVTFLPEDVSVHVAPVYGPPTILPPPGTPSPNATPAYPTGIPAPIGLPGSTGGNVLPLSYDLYQMIVDVIRCQACQAAGCITTGLITNGTYGQMLGLSALTASLLPLADVTPASALAYVSIGSERILGAILLILILNSLVYEIARTRRTGLLVVEPDELAHRRASKSPLSRTAKGSRAAAAGAARTAALTQPPKRRWWSIFFSLAKRGIILVVGGAAVLLTLAALYAAGIYLWSMAQYESSRPRPAVPAAPYASLTATAAPAATGTPTASATPIAVSTPVNTMVPEFEGYYMGTVVIAGYYTLLEKAQYADAYELLSASQRSRYSWPQYQQLQRKSGQVIQIITVQPVRAKQVEAHSPVTSQDTANEITFYVKVRVIAPVNAAGTAFDSRIQTEYLLLTKEVDHWKIGASSTSLEAANPTITVPEAIDPAFVSEVSYYDSLVAISRYYAYFNHGFYREAYDLRSSSSPHLGAYEDWVAGFKLAQIKENSVAAIYPQLENTYIFQIRPTPDPMNRRKFYAQIYAEGAQGWAGSVPNGVHTYFITTLLENAGWKIYSVNTSP